MEQDARNTALCARARDLIPLLTERAERTEALRQLPPETLSDLHKVRARALQACRAPGVARFVRFQAVDAAVDMVAAAAASAYGRAALGIDATHPTI